jgi:hypothetical protein
LAALLLLKEQRFRRDSVDPIIQRIFTSSKIDNYLLGDAAFPTGATAWRLEKVPVALNAQKIVKQSTVSHVDLRSLHQTLAEVRGPRLETPDQEVAFQDVEVADEDQLVDPVDADSIDNHQSPPRLPPPPQGRCSENVPYFFDSHFGAPK